jgi:hypothetical protein
MAIHATQDGAPEPIQAAAGNDNALVVPEVPGSLPADSTIVFVLGESA